MKAAGCPWLHRTVSVFVKLFCIFFMVIHQGQCAEETGKIKADPILAAEMRQRDMLRTSVDPFFTVNNDFLNIVQMNYLRGPIISNLISNITDPSPKVFRTYVDIMLPILQTYPGYVALFLFGFLLFLIVPIVGLFWCMCRCCCKKCGGRVKPMDGKYARCRRGTFGIILGFMCTLILAGAVLAFISNDLLHRPFMVHSPDNPVKKLNVSIKNIVNNLDTILKNFNNQTLQLLIKQVPKVRDAVNNASLEAQTKTIVDSKFADLIASWNTFDSNFNIYQNASATIQSNRQAFINTTDMLSANFSYFISTLQEAFNCSTTECKTALDTVTASKLSFQYATINTTLVEEIQKALVAINNTQMTNFLTSTNDTLYSMHTEIMKIGRAEINTLIGNLNDSKKIETYFYNSEVLIRNITTSLRQFNAVLNNQTMPGGKKMIGFLAEVDQYRMYACIGIGSIVLLIVFFYYLGLCFGACGEPPFEDARFCNRGAGASLMSCGIGFTFFFFPIVMLVTMSLFMTGGPIRTEACRYLLNDVPNGYNILDSELSNILGYLNLTISPGFPFPPNLTYYIMSGCKNDTSIVTAFNLEDLINGLMIYDTEVKPSIVSLQRTIKEIDLGISTPQYVSQVGNYMDALLADQISESSFNTLINELKKPAVNNLNKLLADSLAADRSMSGTLDVSSTVASLTNMANAVDGPKSETLAAYTQLQGITNSKNAAAKLTGKLRNLGDDMKKDGDFLTKIITDSFNKLDSTLKTILVDTVNQVLSQYASCRVLHEQVKGMVDLVCVTILNPFNGFWLGIGWCLIMLIIAMIFACKLNYLYKKTEYYVKDYEEPDYMSYQGFYPSDNIPLERKYRGKNKQAKGRGRNASNSRNSGGGILRHTGPPDPLPSGPGCPGSAAGGMNRRGWQHPYTKLPVYPRDAYD